MLRRANAWCPKLPRYQIQTAARQAHQPRWLWQDSHSSSLFVRDSLRAGCGEFDGFSVGRVAVGVCPCFFAGKERVGLAQAFGDDQALESGEPMMIVARAVIGFAAIRCGFELGGDRGGPLFP